MAEPKKDKRESALPAVSPTAAIFLGVGAARTLADRGEVRPLRAFQKAAVMRSKGASEAAIYAVTNKLLEGSPYAGISYDAAQKPRFEISDHDAKLVPSGLNASGRGAMGDFLRHPELYKALPSAEHLDVNKGGTQGNAAFDGRTVYLGDRNFADQMLAGRPRARQTVRGPLLHEIQHHGQDVGDRPRGASPEDFRSQHPGDSFEAKARRHLQYGRVAGEVESEVSRLSANMTPAERRAEHPNDRAKRFGLAARRDQIVMDRHGRIVEMADPDSVKISAGRDGAVVRFSYDREMVDRFKKAFPKARWNASEKQWSVPGKTADRRAQKWLAAEQDLAGKVAKAEQDARVSADFDRAHPQSRFVSQGKRGYVVKTTYDPAIVKAIKGVPGAEFDSSNKTWLVPYRSAAALKAALPSIESVVSRIEAEGRARDARIEAERAEQRQRWARERAARDVEMARVRQSRFPVLPGRGVREGDVVRHAGQAVVVTGFGKPFRADEGFPSVHGSEWLGHEGDMTKYAYTRPATEAEASSLESREIAAKAAAEQRAEVLSAARKARSGIEAKFGSARAVKKMAAIPDGQTLAHFGKNNSIYGGGTEYRLSSDGKTIWRIQGNGADGDDWSRNNAPGSVVSKIRATKDAIAKLSALGKIESSGLHGTENPNNLKAILEGKAARAKKNAASAEPPSSVKRIVEMADDIKDFGEKIGGARKDRAVKTGPKAARNVQAAAPADAPVVPARPGAESYGENKIRAQARASILNKESGGASHYVVERTSAGWTVQRDPTVTAQKAAGDYPVIPQEPLHEIRNRGNSKQHFVYADGKPLKDAKGNDKWFGSREKAQAFIDKRSASLASVTKAPASVTRETGKTVADQGKPLPSVTRNAGVRDAKVGDNAPPDLDRLTKAAERLEAVAQRTMQKAEAEANRPRLMNTARRARMGSGMIEQAQQEIADAKTALKIAEALRRGEAGALSNVKSLADIRELRRLAKEAEWATDRKEGRNWKPGGHGLKPDDVKNVGGAKGFVRMEPNTVEEIKTALKGKRGLGDAIRTLERYADGTRRNDRTNFETSDPKVFEAVRKVANEIRKAGGDNSLKWQAGKWLEEVRDFNRKVKLAGTDPNARQEALRAFMDVREGKAVPSPAAIAERNLIGMKLPGFFPTPESLAKRMADLADIQKGQMVLEPSAGTGRLADAAKARGATVDTVESQWTLRDILSKKGHNLVADDFTAMNLEPKYDRILMNPPFEKGQDMAHVQRAYDALKPGGKMVAVMGEGGFFRSDRQATEFRAWLEQVRGTSEKLPEGTFKESNTGVNTRLVVIEKPAAVAEAAMKAAATGERHVWDDKARAASAEVRAANAAPVEPGPAVKAARANDVNALAKALNTNATRAADVLKAYKKGRIDDAHLEKVTPRTRMVEMADAPKSPLIGREWDSPYGRQRVARIIPGNPAYGVEDSIEVETVGKGEVRRYRPGILDETIKQDIHRTTPAYQKEIAERAERQRLNEAAFQRQEAEAAKVREQVKGFTDAKKMSPMAAKKAENALLQQVRNNGNIVRTKDLVEQKVAEGYRPEVMRYKGKDTRVLMQPDPDGAFIALNKTALDYAEHLSGLRGAQPAPAPAADAPKAAPRGMDGLTRAERAGKAAPVVAAPAPATGSTLERFRAAYEATLAEQVKANPGKYAYGVDRVPDMARKMTEALAKGQGDHTSPTVKAVTKALGIKPTVGGIKAALNDQPPPAPKPPTEGLSKAEMTRTSNAIKAGSKPNEAVIAKATNAQLMALDDVSRAARQAQTGGKGDWGKINQIEAWRGMIQSAARKQTSAVVETSGLRGTQNPANLAAINANRAANAADPLSAAKAAMDAATEKAKAGNFKRTVTLGDGRKVSLGQYTAAWKLAKALPPDTRVQGSPASTFRNAPNTAGDAVAEFREGMQDRINKHDPAFGKGRKWDSTWQRDARNLRDVMQRKGEVPRGQAHPVDLRPKLAAMGKLEPGTYVPSKGGDRSKANMAARKPGYIPGVGVPQQPGMTYKAPPTPTVADLPKGAFKGSQQDFSSLSPGMRREIARTAEKMAAKKATPQVAPLPGMAPMGAAPTSSSKIGFQNEATLNAALKAQGKAVSGEATPVEPAPKAKPPTVAALKAEAKAAGIKGISKMSKASLMEALGKNVNRIGMVGMVAAPVAAAMVAYDATKSSANAAGADGKTATMQAATAAAVAGGVTAGVGYGIGKGIGLTFKAAAAIAPKVAPMLGPAALALGAGMMGYGAYHGYQKGGWKGAALGAIGADAVLDLGKSAPVTPTATPEGTPRGVDATKASEFESRNTAYNAMQETARGVVEVNTFARERHTESGTVVKEVVKAYTRARPNGM